MTFKCDCNPVHETVVEHVKALMNSDIEIQRVTRFFKAISDQKRLEIMCALSISEMCVNDLANLLNCSKSLVSHQLSKLKEEHQVKARKEGKVVYYSLEDEHVTHILEEAFIHIRHSEYKEGA